MNYSNKGHTRTLSQIGALRFRRLSLARPPTLTQVSDATRGRSFVSTRRLSLAERGRLVLAEAELRAVARVLDHFSRKRGEEET